MKRIKNKYHLIGEKVNLYSAFYKAKKGKESQAEVLLFQENLEQNLQTMAKQISTNTFPIGNYTYFTINDPKKRIICAASFPERVYHHAIMNICHKAFDNYQIYHSYATRPYKGTHKALEYAYRYHSQDGWFVKLDVKKFFDTISHSVLKQFLARRFKEKQLLNAFYQIIDSYNISEGRGLPIGNLTSQYFANFYLAHLDHYVKEVLYIKRYVRYMDDIVFFVKDKKQAKISFERINSFLGQQLLQTFKPKVMNKSPYPFSFLGFVVNKEGITPKKRNKMKYINKLNELNNRLKDNKISEWNANQNYWVLHSFYDYNVKNTN